MKLELAPVTQVINGEMYFIGQEVDPATRMPTGYEAGMPVGCAIAQKIAPCTVPDDEGNPVQGLALYVYDHHGNAVVTSGIGGALCLAEFTLN